MKELEFSNTQEAWEGINEYLALKSDEVMETGGSLYGPEIIAYNHYIKINKVWVDPEFDFGSTFGYTTAKWTKLINNYLHLDYLDLIKSQILAREKKRATNYNISYLFDNSHGSGKGCLLTLTFSRRVDRDVPVLYMTLRSSEVTKRLLFDFLLVQRIAEYVYGIDQSVSLEMFCPNIYLVAESFVMYDNHKSIDRLFRKKKNPTKFEKKILETLHYFKTVDPKTIRYKVHLRSVNQLQENDKGEKISGRKPLLVKDLKLYKESIPYPEDCISPSKRRAFKREYNKKLGK